MMDGRLASGVLMTAGLFLTACTTTDPAGVVGSRAWHEERIAEIHTSYEAGALTVEEYLRLKNDTDRIRVKRYTGVSYSDPL